MNKRKRIEYLELICLKFKQDLLSMKDDIIILQKQLVKHYEEDH